MCYKELVGEAFLWNCFMIYFRKYCVSFNYHKSFNWLIESHNYYWRGSFNCLYDKWIIKTTFARFGVIHVRLKWREGGQRPPPIEMVKVSMFLNVSRKMLYVLVVFTQKVCFVHLPRPPWTQSPRTPMKQFLNCLCIHNIVS